MKRPHATLLPRALVGIAALATIGVLTLAPTHAVGAEEHAADKATKNPVVTIKTSMGEITAELDATKAPSSTRNFIEYAKAGFYDGTVFHRVIGNFMIQGGGMDADLKPKAGLRAPIANEADNGLANDRGTLAMARTGAPDSATAQFFINVKDNDFLNHRNKTPQGYGYAVFGRVIAGMDVVDAIKETPTIDKGMYRDVPVEPVVIESVTVKE